MQFNRIIRTRSVLLLLAALCWGLAGMAQTGKDSADIYFRHLDLNEVTVTGLTGQSHLREMPAPVSVVTQRELQATAATNLIDAISHQPGISQITTGSGISKPVVRGLGYNRVAVVADGIRQEGQQWGDEHGTEIDAQSVGQVEVLKGPASLMYGSDAMAGVLIFHAHHIPAPGQTTASATTGYQTNNGLFDYSVGFAGNERGFVWSGRWSQKWAHAYKNALDGYVPGSQFSEQAARLLLGENGRWGHSHLVLSYYHLRPGIVEGERDSLSGRLLSDAPDDVKTYDAVLPFQQVNHYKAVWDNSLRVGEGRLKVLLGYQQNRRQEYEESADDCELNFRLHTLSYDVRYELATAYQWKLAAGLGGMWQRSENLGEEYLIPAYRLFDAGAFATASRQWGRWNATGGLRLDRRWLHSEALAAAPARFSDFRRSYSGFSASLGVVLNATEQLNLRANLSRGFRAPNLSELGSNGVHEGTVRYEVGNPDLKAEHSWQLDLGADFSSRYVSAQLALFANRIDHFIYVHRTQEVLNADYATYRYASGDARLMGLEAQADFHPVHSLHFENTFGMVDAVQLHQSADSRYLPFTPAPRWTSELKWELSHDGQLFDNTYVAFGLECYLAQHHYYKADQTETATPSYTLFSLSAGTDLRPRGRHLASLYVSVQNLFDRVYQNHLSRLKYTERNAVTGRQGISNMGRNVSLRLVVPLVVERKSRNQ